MPRVITTLQAMSHPTVVATINVLSEMSQRLQDENDELKAALAQPKRRKWYGLTYEDMDNLVAYPWGETKDLVIAIEAKLKEYNT